MQAEQGTTKNGLEWTVLLDHQGFHFSICKDDVVLAELMPVPGMSRDLFDAKILSLEAELLEANVCETELLDVPKEISGSTE